MKNRLLLLLLGVALAAPAWALRYAGEFLEIGVGARGVAMGGAMCSVTDDASSFYWNPAGQGYVTGVQIAGMYADLWDGLANYSSAGVSLPVSGAVFAANFIRLGVPDIGEHPDYALLPNRIVNGDTLSVQEYLLRSGAKPRGVFADNESALFLTFSKVNRITLDFGWSYFTLPMELPIGANVKIINQSLHGAKGSGIGADLGAQLRIKTSDLIWEKWKGQVAVGFDYQDLTRTSVDWGENNKDAIPPNLRHGVSFTQTMPGRDSRLTVSYDAEKRYDFTHHYGAEYRFERVLALRGGYFKGSWGSEWTAGAGVSIWRATVDYAYLARELGSTHRVSVALQLR